MAVQTSLKLPVQIEAEILVLDATSEWDSLGLSFSCFFNKEDLIAIYFCPGHILVECKICSQNADFCSWVSPLSILQIFNEVLCFMFTEKVVLKPHDVSVFTTLSVNGRLFACPRDQFDSLVCMYAVLRKFSSSVNLNAWYVLYYQCFR